MCGIIKGVVLENQISVRREAPSAPLKGELLSEREAEGFSCTALLTDKPLRFR